MNGERDALRLGGRALAFEAGADHVGHVDRHDLERLVVGLDAGQHQHVEDQVMQPVGLFFDAGQESLTRFRVGVGAVAERFGIRLDRTERSLELMRNIGHEIAADRFEPAKLGRVVDHEHHAGARLARQRLHVNIDVQLLLPAR